MPPPRQQRIVCALDGLGHSPERGIVASEHADGRYDGSDGGIFFLMHFSYKASILGCILVSYDGSDGSIFFLMHFSYKASILGCILVSSDGSDGSVGNNDRHLWAPPDRHGLPRRSPSACSEIVKKKGGLGQRTPQQKERSTGSPAVTNLGPGNRGHN